MESKKKTADTANLVRINRAKEACRFIHNLGITFLFVFIIIGVISMFLQPATFLSGIIIILLGVGAFGLLLALETIIKLLIMIYLKDN